MLALSSFIFLQAYSSGRPGSKLQVKIINVSSRDTSGHCVQLYVQTYVLCYILRNAYNS